MDKETGQSINSREAVTNGTPPVEAGSSRRRFTRNAVLGSAVVFTLGNRTAWGGNSGQGNNGVCISINTFNSMMNYENGVRASMSPTTADAIKAYQEELKRPNRVAVQADGQSCVVQKQAAE